MVLHHQIFIPIVIIKELQYVSFNLETIIKFLVDIVQLLGIKIKVIALHLIAFYFLFLIKQKFPYQQILVMQFFVIVVMVRLLEIMIYIFVMDAIQLVVVTLT
jgi:hypothetical protein